MNGVFSINQWPNFTLSSSPPCFKYINNDELSMIKIMMDDNFIITSPGNYCILGHPVEITPCHMVGTST